MDAIFQLAAETIRAEMAALEATILLIFGSEEEVIRAKAEWPIAIASVNSTSGLSVPSHFLTMDKQCPIHGGYSNMRPIETREDWERAKAEFDLNECLTCAKTGRSRR